MRTVAIILVFNITGIMASIFDTLLPTRSPGPSDTDAWYCYTTALTRFFEVPHASGALETAISSYVNTVLVKDCQRTLTDAMGYRTCTFPPHSQFCHFTTAIPESMLPEYTSFASSAASWWASISDEAVRSAEVCYRNWFRAMIYVPGGAYFLNETIAWAGCYAAAHPSPAMTTKATISATPRSGATTTGPRATSTATTKKSNAAARAEGLDMWVVSSGVAAAVANSVL